MKTGKNVQELAAELVRINESKRDFIVKTSKIEMNNEGQIGFETKNGKENFSLNGWSSGQVAEHADIPKQYFDRIQAEDKALLALNVNHGLKRVADNKPKAGRLVRVLDGKVRGFLSSSYRMLDAHDLMQTILPVLIDNNFEVNSSEITDKKLYIKASSPKLTGEVKAGDIVQFGLTVQTSDVGAGSLSISPFINRLACTNGMIMANNFRQAHLGKNNIQDNIQELLSDNTKQQIDEAFFSTVRDYLLGTVTPEMFQREIDKMRGAATQVITRTDLEEVVELSMRQVGVRGEGVKKNILYALAAGNEGAGLTRWGLANSFTSAAKSEELDYDTATELERAGGAILELEPTQWQRIAA